MPTVKELIEEYGERLRGMWVEQRGTKGVIAGYDTDPCPSLTVAASDNTTHMVLGHVRLIPAPSGFMEIKELIKAHGVTGLLNSLVTIDTDYALWHVREVDTINKYFKAELNGTIRRFQHGLSTCKFMLTQPTVPKTPFELLDFGFAGAMCECWGDGVKAGRVADDWQHLPRTDETKSAYVAKIMRHLRDYVEGKGSKHLAAIACDANIIWHLSGRGE